MIPEAVQTVRDALASAGIRSHVDPKRVAIPGAWINPREIRGTTLDGAMNVVLDVHLVVPDQAAGSALTQLDALLGRALTVIEPDGAIETAEVLQTDKYALPCFTVPVIITTQRKAR